MRAPAGGGKPLPYIRGGPRVGPLHCGLVHLRLRTTRKNLNKRIVICEDPGPKTGGWSGSVLVAEAMVDLVAEAVQPLL